jgi:cytochrome d ubiquinol oxidase subunit I
MVALGTFMSAFWIVSVNSWMQTPAGYAVNAKGQFVAVDWFAVVFNPSMPYRLVHMVLAAYLTTAFVVGAVAALHLLRDNRTPAVRLMFSMAMGMAAVVAPLQIAAGDAHGVNTLQYQPAKIAALEGDFETRAHAPLILFGLPNMKTEHTDDALEIPWLGSLILTHSLDGTIKGLKDFPAADRPFSPLLFWSFRIMVGLGFAMFGLGLWSLYLRWRDELYDTPWMHRAALLMGPSGFIAVLAGWTTTEAGRQPYTVYGLLRTVDSVSPVAAAAVGSSLAAFVVVYFILFGAGVFYILRLMNKPPHAGEPELPPDEPIRASGVNPAPAMAEAVR